jgi:hypothetical protein
MLPDDEWSGWTQAKNAGFRIKLSPELGDAVRALPVEIKWLTTWESYGANEVVGLALGWEPLFVLDRTGCDEEPWWKLHALLRDHDMSRPLVWIDDDLVYNAEVVLDALAAASAAPHLLLCPDPMKGITRAHLELVGRFAARPFYMPEVVG